MLAVDEQSTILGITGHTNGMLYWMPLVNVWKLFIAKVSFSSDCIWLTESIGNPWPPSAPWTKASQQIADKIQNAGETIKTNWEASKKKQRGNPAWSLDNMQGNWWSDGWATRREKGWPRHELAQHRGSALSDNRAVDPIHVERQTHVRRNILYRLYLHYFLEKIKYRLVTLIDNQ